VGGDQQGSGAAALGSGEELRRCKPVRPLSHTLPARCTASSASCDSRARRAGLAAQGTQHAPSLRALGVAVVVAFNALRGSGKAGSAGGMTWPLATSVTAEVKGSAGQSTDVQL
jgi:hypothetical protein